MKKPTKPTLKAAVLAKCHRCMGEFADGIRDCGVVGCPLYPWMIRGGDEVDLTWLEYNPKRQGLVRWEDCKTREMSDEQKEAMTRAREKAILKKQLNL